MLRIVYRGILPGMLLATYAILVCADAAMANPGVANPGAVAQNRQMYSSRPVGFTVPTAYFGTPMAHRFIVPPVRQVMPMMPVQPVQPIQPVQPVQMARIDIATPTFVTTAPGTQQVVREAVVMREALPKVDINDELDGFYARLAKIQLERRQLPEALALVAQIRSDAFKVRTLVDLAEYVSRDRTYQAEAAELYRLALAGMEALRRGQPFRIETGGAGVAIPQTAPQPVVQPPVVQLVDPVDRPVAQPVNQPVAQPVDPPGTPRPPLFDPPAIIMPQPIDDPPVNGSPPDPVRPGGGTVGHSVAIPPDNTAGRNGRTLQPPPPPPDNIDGTNGIVSPSPGNQASSALPPLVNNGHNGLTPPPSHITTPNDDPPPGSSNGTVTDTVTTDITTIPSRPVDDGIVRPEPRIILEDLPGTVVRGEEAPQPPPTTRPARPSFGPIIIPDEN